jgi:hypothetical protein
MGGICILLSPSLQALRRKPMKYGYMAIPFLRGNGTPAYVRGGTIFACGDPDRGIVVGGPVIAVSEHYHRNPPPGPGDRVEVAGNWLFFVHRQQKPPWAHIYSTNDWGYFLERWRVRLRLLNTRILWTLHVWGILEQGYGFPPAWSGGKWFWQR